jgi:hypothetical protein
MAARRSVPVALAPSIFGVPFSAMGRRKLTTEQNEQLVVEGRAQRRASVPLRSRPDKAWDGTQEFLSPFRQNATRGSGV